MFGREGCDPSTFFHYLRQPPAWGLSLWQHSMKAKERHPELHASRSAEARRTQVADATFRDKWRPKALSLTRTGGEIWRSCKQRRNDLEFLHATRAAMGTISTCQGFNTKQIAQNGLEAKVKFWEFLRYALRLHLLFSLFGDKSNTSMDMSGSGCIPPLPNVLVYLLSYNLVAAAGTERWLTWEKQESGAGMIWPSNLAPKIQSSYPLVRSNSSVVERLREK